MRSSKLAFLVAPFALIACEQGPLQSFTPASPDAAAFWNNGQTPGSVDDKAANGFEIPSNGTTKVDLCPADVKAMKWSEMVKKPIVPPRHAAGLDTAGDDNWIGLTIEAAEAVNCQSDSQGDRFGNGDLVNSWGDNGEVWAEYRVSTRKVNFLTLWPGYVGTMDFKSPDGAHTYQIAISQQIKKDGKNYTLDWTGNEGKNFIPQADELFRALIGTYSGLPQEDVGVTCFDVGRCIKGAFGDVAYFYIPSIGFAFWIDNQHANQPVPSIATRLDIDPVKILPYAFSRPTLKMDAEGPTGTNTSLLAKAKIPCTLKLGLTYGEFLPACVKVNNDPAADLAAVNMLLGGLSHGTERFGFNVSGVDINFTDLALKPDDIVHDSDRPHDNDIATSFVVDQSTLGAILNDRAANGKDIDLHGSGAVYKEYARLVRLNLLALAKIPDGDTSKCLYPANYKGTEADFIAQLPPYCTGFEGFITAAPPTRKGDPTNLGPTDALTVNSALKLGFKLGHTKSSFCWDANGDITTGYLSCKDNGDVFTTSFNRVLKVMGRGKLSSLPSDAQDQRFFFKQYFTAMAKYFTVGDQNPVPDISAITLNPDELFFDSVGAGQFEIAEYVDRRFASKTQDPLDIRFTADVKNGIFSSYVFSRDLFRGETAVYKAMLEDSVNDVPGQETTALLTNIFGSPMLKQGWKDAKVVNGMYTAYYCATHMDPANCDKQLPPVDANGALLRDELNRPLLAPYPGAFGATAFTLGPTAVKITQLYPNIQSAMVRIPAHVNPYDQKSKGLPFFDMLIPWLPNQPGVGFPVALNGTLDKFIQTAQLDFSGTTLSANIDYQYTIDPMTMMPSKDGAIEFLAVETTDFLGRVFLCQDPGTKDLLWARMYTTAADVLQWMLEHPAAVDACGIIVRESPLNNFPDYITSLNGGVRLGITQGGGLGRVVDVTLFVPGQ